MNPVVRFCLATADTSLHSQEWLCYVRALPAATNKRLRSKLFLRFAFEALKMYRTRSRVLRRNLASDLFAQRHTGHESRVPMRVAKMGRSMLRPCGGSATNSRCESRRGHQAVARGVG